VLLANGKETGAVEARAAEAAVKHIRSGRNVIVHTALGASDPRLLSTAQILAERASAGHRQSAQLFGNAMAQVIREVLPRTGIRRVLLAGGDTAGYTARALGIEALEMLAPLTPGAPLCRADAPNSPADGLEICFKGGQIGPVDFFQKVSGHRKHEN